MMPRWAMPLGWVLLAVILAGCQMPLR